MFKSAASVKDRLSKKAGKGDSCELEDSNVIVESSLMPPIRLRNLAIVVVEDHNDTRRFLDIFLGHLGAKVVVAGNAIEGLAAVKTCHPNLVFSDISTPGRDGFELLSDIRALGPDAGGNVPVREPEATIANTYTEAQKSING